MRKLTRNLPIQGVVGFSGFRGEILTRGGEKFRRGIETPVGVQCTTRSLVIQYLRGGQGYSLNLQ